MIPPAFTAEKCKYCGKRKLLMGGTLKSKWVCPVCGRTNKKKPFPLGLA